MAEEGEAEGENRCIWCGSKRIVTSVTEMRAGELKLLGWICRRCYDEIPEAEKAERYMFGYEGWISESRTVWNVQAEAGGG